MMEGYDDEEDEEMRVEHEDGERMKQEKSLMRHGEEIEVAAHFIYKSLSERSNKKIKSLKSNFDDTDRENFSFLRDFFLKMVSNH